MEMNGNISSHQSFILNGFDELGALRPILFIPYSLMFFMSLVGNTLLIYIIISQKSLHSPMYILIAANALIDLMILLPFTPHMLLSFLFNWRGISLSACLLQMFFSHFLGCCHSTVLLWMSLDRYFAICTPLQYHENMMLKNIVKFAVPLVIRNIFMLTLMVTLVGKLRFCGGNVINHCFCEHMAVVELACGSTTINSLVGLLCVFFIPVADFIFVTTSYLIIFNSVLRSGKSGVKALHTCVTHIMVITLTVLISLIVFLSFRIRNNLPVAIRVFLSTMYPLFPSCFNPVIYGFRTKEIQQQIIKTLRVDRF